jgi:hypothetical protein
MLMSEKPDLLDCLDDLRKSLSLLSDRLKASGVERTTGLRKNMGDDCAYYRKSKDLFLRRDYDEIYSLTKKVMEQFQLVEGPDG